MHLEIQLARLFNVLIAQVLRTVAPHHVSRKAICTSRGSPTPSRKNPLKSNSKGELRVLMLFLLLNELNISTVGIKVKRSPIMKSRWSRQSNVKYPLSFLIWLRPQSTVTPGEVTTNRVAELLIVQGAPVDVPVLEGRSVTGCGEWACLPTLPTIFHGKSAYV